MALVMGDDEPQVSEIASVEISKPKRKVLSSKVKSKREKKIRTEETLDDVVQLFDVTTFIVPEADEEYNGLLIKEGVSVDEWNKFLLREHRYRGMLWFDNGNVYIVEVPNRPHENAVQMVTALLAPLVIQDHIQAHGTNCWVGADNIGREVDQSYSPVHAPPAGVNVRDYVTFVIEVGHSQTMGNLRQRKVTLFANYPTVYYILLISISAQMNSLRAELWERGVANAVQTVNFSHPGGHLITLNTRRLLDIAAAAPLPGGLGVNTQINLDRVRVAIRR